MLDSFASLRCIATDAKRQAHRDVRAGMTLREIQGFLLGSYAAEVSAELISGVTEALMAEVTA